MSNKSLFYLILIVAIIIATTTVSAVFAPPPLLRRAAPPVRASPACKGNLTDALEQIGDGVVTVLKGFYDCRINANNTKCWSQLHDLANELSTAGADVTNAQTGCVGASAVCKTDLTGLSSTCDRMSQLISQAIVQCEQGNSIQCNLLLDQAAQGVPSLFEDTKQAFKDCLSS